MQLNQKRPTPTTDTKHGTTMDNRRTWHDARKDQMPKTLFATDRETGAIFSPCRTWRYQLWRGWDIGKPAVMFIGLNPSTADETQDDPTIRRCIDYAKRWGFGKYIMCNLFAFRSTDPAGLKTIADPVGLENDAYIRQAATEAKMIVAAWGSQPCVPERATAVLDMLQEVHCLGTNADGQPKHPLYLKATLLPVLYQGV